MRLCLLLLLLFSFISQGGSLKIPEQISIISINGQEYQNSLFASDNQIQLTTGQQLLVLEYKDIFENYEDDDHSTVRSEPYVVIFNSQDQDEFFLKLPEISDEDQARAFAKTFKIGIFTALNHKHPIFIQDLMKYKAGLVVNHQSEKVAGIISDDTAGHLLPDIDDDALIQLKHWWQLASEKQKRHFMHYLLLQEQMSSNTGNEGRR